MTNYEKYKYEAYHFPDDNVVKMVMSEESYMTICNILEEYEQLKHHVEKREKDTPKKPKLSKGIF